MESLSDPPTAQRMLQRQMTALDDAAEDCHAAATAIDEKFDLWLCYVQEFHASCEQTSSDTHESLERSAIEKLVAQTRVDQSKEAKKNAEGVAAKLSAQLDMTSKAFKNAARKMPSG